MKATLENYSLISALKNAYEIISNLVISFNQLYQGPLLTGVVGDVKGLLSCIEAARNLASDIEEIVQKFEGKIGDLSTLSGRVDLVFDLLCEYSQFVGAINELNSALSSSGLQRYADLGDFSGRIIKAVADA